MDSFDTQVHCEEALIAQMFGLASVLMTEEELKEAFDVLRKITD